MLGLLSSSGGAVTWRCKTARFKYELHIASHCCLFHAILICLERTGQSAQLTLVVPDKQLTDLSLEKIISI